MTTIDSSAQIDIDIPPDFHEVPLDLAVEDRAAAQSELLEVLDLDDGDRREGLGWFLEAMARMVREGPVVGTAFCAVAIDQVPSTATLTVATRAMPSDDPLVFAQGTYESMRAQNTYVTVQLERIGAVTGVVATRELMVAERHSYQVTAVVPVPDQRLGVFVTVATDDRAHLSVYERVARDAAASVRVATP
ncbi:MAG: hypothetical protein ACRDO7_10985 [Nocardioidaceae bacterium]